ncbi:hypothetical protein QFZ53_000013 [Microbacterium natoriense]|uniref:Uncharacterized protein n=1 Tax=Microbacterium natoriense TaxID=284570 RepID=A0AAW8ERC4_9MICO|nr:hypothetical protein [Microbacterium natoriense]
MRVPTPGRTCRRDRSSDVRDAAGSAFESGCRGPPLLTSVQKPLARTKRFAVSEGHPCGGCECPRLVALYVAADCRPASACREIRPSDPTRKSACARENPRPLSLQVPMAAHRRPGVPVRKRPRLALPADPEQGSHRQGRRPGRHRLHLANRAVHAVRLARPDRRIDHRDLLRRSCRDGRRSRHPRRRLRQGERILRARGLAVRRRLADHPQHQRRAAGADARDDGRDDVRHRTAARDRRHHHGRHHQRESELAHRRLGAGHAHRGAAHHQPHGAAVPEHAEEDRQRQPHHARAADGRPRRPRVRAPRTSRRSASAARTPTSWWSAARSARSSCCSSRCSC